MSDVPKIVYERLRAAAREKASPGGIPGEHPEPDVLAAFAEQALPPAEREGVLEHLALCGDCREVVAVSLPPSEAAESPTVENVEEMAALAPMPAGTSRAREAKKEQGWFTWPRLTWAALAAGVVVASVLLLRPGKPEGPEMAKVNERAESKVAEKKAPSALAPNAVQPSSQPAAVPTKIQPSGGQFLAKESPANRTVAPEPLANSEVSSAERQVAAERKFPHDFFKKSGVARASVPSALATDSQSVLHGLANAKPMQPEQYALDRADALKNDKAMVAKSTGAIGGPAVAPPAANGALFGRANETVEVSTATPVIQTTQAAPANVIAENKPSMAAPAVTKAKPALQKNEQVEVTGASVAAEESAITASVSEAPLNGRNVAQLAVMGPNWRVEGGALKRSWDNGSTWQEILGAKHRLICYAARGAEIWAGGKAGALFHSADGGANWTPVNASADGRLLSADVTRIEARSTTEVVLSTSSGESWATLDGGKSWVKK
ncbi:MAG: YCF48-related protein [Terriglobales bacterium]